MSPKNTKRSKTGMTTEQLADKVAQDVQQMAPEEKAAARQAMRNRLKKPRRPRREYGIGDFLSYIHSGGGLVNAVKKIQEEEQLMLNYDPAGKRVN